MKDKKTKAIHGKGWKRAVNISAEKYEAITKAISRVLTKKPLKFTELAEKVGRELKNFSGSVEWYTISVLRELETQGKVKRTKSKPVRYSKPEV